MAALKRKTSTTSGPQNRSLLSRTQLRTCPGSWSLKGAQPSSTVGHAQVFGGLGVLLLFLCIEFLFRFVLPVQGFFTFPTLRHVIKSTVPARLCQSVSPAVESGAREMKTHRASAETHLNLPPSLVLYCRKQSREVNGTALRLTAGPSFTDAPIACNPGIEIPPRASQRSRLVIPIPAASQVISRQAQLESSDLRGNGLWRRIAQRRRQASPLSEPFPDDSPGSPPSNPPTPLESQAKHFKHFQTGTFN